MSDNNALFIDGPWRGTVRQVNSHRIQYFDGSLASLDNIQQKIYYIHKFYLCGRFIMIGSTKLLIDDISPDDAFEAIASTGAKDAAE